MKLKPKYIFLGILVVGLVFVYGFFDIGRYFSRESMKTIVEQAEMWGPLLFALIYIVALIMLLPSSLFSVLGGVLFGTVWGMIIVVISATLSATIGFLLAKYFTKEIHFNPKNKHLAILMKKARENADTAGLKSIIILRLLYLPYMGLSYAAGLVKEVKLQDFVLGTFLTNIVGSFTFVYFGDAFGKSWTAFIIPVVLIILTLLIPKLVKKLQKKH